MQWKDKFQESFKWHRWFAWYPVTIGSTVYWLEWVERRRTEGVDLPYERKELE